MRLVLIFLALAALLALPFLLWGEAFEGWLAGARATEWLRAQGALAPIAAIALLVADLVLPVPATAVMAALGILYGAALGGLIGAAGSFLAGCAAYGASRALGRRAAVFLAGEKDLARGERFFERAGGWAVALSRWMPVLPEAVACLAGLARMPARRFLLALACGSAPMAFTFAALGAAGASRPALALCVSALAPLALWPLASRLARERHAKEKDGT